MTMTRQLLELLPADIMGTAAVGRCSNLQQQNDVSVRVRCQDKIPRKGQRGYGGECTLQV